MAHYKTGQACMNGHAVASDVATPFAADFCPQCGAKTISQCPKCKAPLRGRFHVDGVFGGEPWTPDSHCTACGKPLPWTQGKLDALKELAEAIDELTDFERGELAELMPHLIQETPRTQPAGFKVAVILARMKGPGKAALRELLNDLAVEAAKRAMGF